MFSISLATTFATESIRKLLELETTLCAELGPHWLSDLRGAEVQLDGYAVSAVDTSLLLVAFGAVGIHVQSVTVAAAADVGRVLWAHIRVVAISGRLTVMACFWSIGLRGLAWFIGEAQLSWCRYFSWGFKPSWAILWRSWSAGLYFRCVSFTLSNWKFELLQFIVWIGFSGRLSDTEILTLEWLIWILNTRNFLFDWFSMLSPLLTS